MVITDSADAVWSSSGRTRRPPDGSCPRKPQAAGAVGLPRFPRPWPSNRRKRAGCRTGGVGIVRKNQSSARRPRTWWLYFQKHKHMRRSTPAHRSAVFGDCDTSDHVYTNGKQRRKKQNMLVCASKNGSRWSSRIVQTLFGHPPNGPGVHPMAAARENRKVAAAVGLPRFPHTSPSIKTKESWA